MFFKNVKYSHAATVDNSDCQVAAVAAAAAAILWGQKQFLRAQVSYLLPTFCVQ